MNWLDYVILGIVVIAALTGMKRGLIGAAFTAVGVYVGWLLAGQFSGSVGELFSDSLSNDTLVTVISYAIIILVAVAVASILVKFVRPLLTVFTLGLSSMVDRLGGLALGLIAGVGISAVLIVGLARLTYNFDVAVPEEGLAGRVAGQVTQRLPRIEDARESLERSLTESQLVSVFINVADTIPASTLGFVPSDFKVALDILDSKID